MLANNAHALRLVSTNYFEPINEGVISVLPFNATLTPVGQVMRLYARHQGQRLLRASITRPEHGPGRHRPLSPAAEVAAEVALLVTTDESRVLITAANCVAAAPRTIHLSLPGWHVAWGEAEAVLLRAEGIDPLLTRTVGGSGWLAEPTSIMVGNWSHGAAVPLTLPPYSIVQVSVGVRQPRQAGARGHAHGARASSRRA